MAANQRIIKVSLVSYEASYLRSPRTNADAEHTVGSRSVGPVNNAQVGDAKGIRQKITEMKMRLIKDALSVGWPNASCWARFHSFSDCESCGIPVPA